MYASIFEGGFDGSGVISFVGVSLDVFSLKKKRLTNTANKIYRIEACSALEAVFKSKINSELISFINGFKQNFNIALDPIYTGKMMFGIFDLIEKGFFQKGSKILAIHTGGLQGIEGMNSVLKKRNLPLIS